MKDDGRPVPRSHFLRQGLSLLLGKVVEGVEGLESRFVEKRFRPPGSLPESEFLTTCQRCQACVRACEPGVLRVLPARAGVAAGTPVLEPENGPCQMCPELPCASACPSGALKPVPLSRVAIGMAWLAPARCVAFQGQECRVCLEVCPVEGKAILFEGGVPSIQEARCTGCGLCSFGCIAHPTAIRSRHR